MHKTSQYLPAIEIHQYLPAIEIRRFLITILCLLAVCGVQAADPDGASQLPQAPASRFWLADTADTQQLKFNITSTLFFRDNEISTPLMRGYTLPGFRLSPTISYRPTNLISVELGLYAFRFWGTDEYPNLAYSDIAYWKGKENVARGFHLLPLFRVQMGSAQGLAVVLGSIYGGRYHRLIEPLYAPELNLIADPESGAQILYANKWLDSDVWVNWESFIYRGDTHQEAFTFGVSARLKYNDENRPVHVYSPVQILFQHRGGEIDTIYTNSVQTLFNGAAGIASRFELRHPTFRSLTLQADALLYNQQVGNIWPFDHGWAYFLHGHLDVRNVKLKAGYFHGHKFVSLFGYPFFGGISVSNEGLTFDNVSTWLAGLNYDYQVAPGYTIGANAVIFRHITSGGIRDGEPVYFGPSTSFCGSLYFRLNPSFLIKSFK